MATSLPESSAVQLVQPVQRSATVAAVAGGATGAYMIGPVAPPAPRPRRRPRRPVLGCCTVAKGKKGAKAASWRAQFDLPSLTALEALSKPGGGPAVQHVLFPERPARAACGDDDGSTVRTLTKPTGTQQRRRGGAIFRGANDD